MTRYGFEDDHMDGISWSMIDRQFACRGYNSYSGETKLEPLQPVQRFLIDTRNVGWGCLSFRPFDARFVPLGQQRPEIPTARTRAASRCFNTRSLYGCFRRILAYVAGW